MKEGSGLDRGDKGRPEGTRNQGRTVRTLHAPNLPTGLSSFNSSRSEAVCILKLTGRSSLRLFLASGHRGARLVDGVRVMTLRTRVQPGYD
jgi:hypothetical protein